MRYKYTDVTIQIDQDHEKDIIAGFHDTYKKAMVISDRGIKELEKVHEASVIYPTGSTKEQQSEIVKAAEQRGIVVKQAVSGSNACLEHYLSQKVIEKEPYVIICEVYKAHTAVSLMRWKGTGYCTQETICIEEGEANSEDEHATLYHMLSSVRQLKHKYDIATAKVLLSGRFFKEKTKVQHMKTRLKDDEVNCYKPEHALALGGCLFLRRCGRRHPAQEFSDRFVRTHCTLPLSQLETLSPKEQGMYHRKLKAVARRDKEFFVESEEFHAQSFLDVYEAISQDFPEFWFTYDYGKVKLKQVRQGEKKQIIEEIPYKKKSDKETLERIEKKADEIIQTCVNGRTLSDDELIKAVYQYMTTHFEYTKEPKKNGKFPAYTHSIAALLYGGVCQGYAYSLVFLLRNKLQVPAAYVSGEVLQQKEVGDHGWNVIESASAKHGYQYYDVTFDLGRTNKYFALQDEQMRVRGHWVSGRYKKLGHG